MFVKVIIVSFLMSTGEEINHTSWWESDKDLREHVEPEILTWTFLENTIVYVLKFQFKLWFRIIEFNINHRTKPWFGNLSLLQILVV